MYKIVNDALNYGKYVAYMKGQLSDYVKVYKQKWGKVMYKQYSKCKNWHCVYFSNEIYF